MTNLRIYRTFSEFYPFYLSEHGNRISRRLHFAGTSIVVLLVSAALITREWWLMAPAVIQAYALAWIGHFFFERNKPATFSFPLLSLLGDWRMWWEMLTGRIRF